MHLLDDRHRLNLATKGLKCASGNSLSNYTTRARITKILKARLKGNVTKTFKQKCRVLEMVGKVPAKRLEFFEYKLEHNIDLEINNMVDMKIRDYMQTLLKKNDDQDI